MTTAIGTLISDGSTTWHVDDVRDGHLTGDIVFRHILRPGYIKANGALLLRAAYPRLWAYVTKNSLAVTETEWSGGLQGMYSVGDGSTTFRVPDLRGEFIRALDDGRGIDIDRQVGSAQNDQIQGHDHSPVSAAFYSSDAASGNVRWDATAINNDSNARQKTTIVTDDTNGTPRVGNETRSRNIALLAQIKY